MKGLILNDLGGSDNTFTNTNKPTPAAFGTGPIWIDGKENWSDGVSFNPLKFNNRTIKVVVFGDSTAEITSYTGNYDLQNISPLFAGSGTTTDASFLVNKWNLQNKYPDCRLIANGGIGGEKVQQMLDRDSLATSASRKSISDVIDSSPDLIIVRAGSINDFQTLTAANYTALVDALYLAHIELINKLLSTGVPVIDEGFFGYSGAGYPDPVATRQAIAGLNGRYKTFAATNNNLFFLDVVGSLTDAQGNYLPEISLDGVHLAEKGGMLLSDLESVLVTKIFGVSRGNSYLGTNLFPDPMFLNRTALAFGERANLVTIVASGTDRTNAKIISDKGKTWQLCTFTTTSGNGTGGFYINVDTANIVAGTRYGIEVDLSISCPSPVKFTSISASLSLTHATLGVFNIKNIVNSTIDNTVSEYTGKLTFMPFVSTINGVDLVAPSRIILQLDAPNVGDIYTLGVANPRIVAVP